MLKRRYLFGLIAGVCCLAAASAVRAESPGEAQMRKDIFFLASDECEGRGVTTKGINLAADYIASEFQKAGLKPAGADGSFFQPFTIAGAILGTPNRLRLTGPQGQTIDLALGRHFEVLGLAHAGKVSAPLVFVGYGATGEKSEPYDDYRGVDVHGKIVVALRDLPRAGNRYFRFAKTRGQEALTSKMNNAQKHGAAAILFVNDKDTAKDGDDLLGFAYSASSSSGAKLPALHLRREVLDHMTQSALGTTLAELERDIDQNLRPHGAELSGWTASLEVAVHRGKIPVKNIVGVLEGSGPLANETVILGAHYDHLGYGGFGSLAGMKKQAIHHGADDNGSGSTALMELARRFAAQPKRIGRRLVFMAFSAEESGLIGSAYYCSHPLFPLDGTAVMVNMDMVGRLRPDRRSPITAFAALLAPSYRDFPLLAPLVMLTKGDLVSVLGAHDKLTVYGTGTSQGFDSLIESLNQHFGFRFNKIRSGFGPSDQQSFYQKKIPVFFFFTDDHDDYHRPSDTADKINIAGMGKVVDFVEQLTDRLTTAPERPQYVKISGEQTNLGRYAGMPRLSIRPGNYGEEDGGVLVGGVIDGGAAARGGIKEGDRIVSIAGKAIKDMSGYMNILVTQKRGKPLEIGVVRDGKRLVLLVTPD